MPLTRVEKRLLGSIIKYIAKRTLGGSMFKEMLLKNWPTTLAGLIGAIAMVVYDELSKGTVDTETIIKAAAIAAIGFVSKSFNVSGTKP